VISPTRELALQIYDVLQEFLIDIEELKSALFVGGTNPSDDLNNFDSNGLILTNNTYIAISFILALTYIFFKFYNF
jgi:superfamily II DNA/RNA helicase